MVIEINFKKNILSLTVNSVKLTCEINFIPSIEEDIDDNQESIENNDEHIKTKTDDETVDETLDEGMISFNEKFCGKI